MSSTVLYLKICLGFIVVVTTKEAFQEPKEVNHL